MTASMRRSPHHARWLRASLSGAAVLAGVLLGGCDPSPVADRGGTPEALAATPSPGPTARDDRADGQATLSAAALGQVKAATVFIESRYRPIDKERAYVKDTDLLVMNGSGFVIGSEGLILTNAHCVQAVVTDERPAEGQSHGAADLLGRAVYVLHAVSVRTDSGTGRSKIYDAQVLCTRPDPVDLALLRVRPARSLPTLELRAPAGGGTAAALRENARVWAIGFPLGESLERALAGFQLSRNPNGPDVSIREGTVTALREDGDRRLKVIEHGCKIEHGNSGGPLVDHDGRVVGINFAGMGRATSFAIPAETARAQFAETLAWIARGKAGRRVLKVGAAADLAQTLAGARPGDIVELPAGEFPIPPRLAVPDGVWLRGAGTGQTILLGTEGKRSIVTIGRGDTPDAGELYGSGLQGALDRARSPARGGYLEVSDLSFGHLTRTDRRHARRSLLVAVASGAGPETYVHDVTAYSSFYPVVFVHGAGSPNLVHAEVSHGGAGVSGTVAVGPAGGGRARLENLVVRGGLVVIGPTEPAVEGCRLGGTASIEPAALQATQGAAPSVRGCSLADSCDGFVGVLVAGAHAHFRWCNFRRPVKSPLIEIRGGGDVRVEESSLAAPSGCVRLADAGSRAVLTGNVFHSLLGPAVEVQDSAAATVVNNLFRAEAPFIGVAGDPQEKRIYGLDLQGPDVAVDYAGNVFHAVHPGTAIRFRDGAADRGGDGNVFRGGWDKRRERR